MNIRLFERNGQWVVNHSNRETQFPTWQAAVEFMQELLGNAEAKEEPTTTDEPPQTEFDGDPAVVQ